MGKFYTIDDVSEILSVTRQTVSKYIKEEKMNAVKLGKSYRIYEPDFVEFINDRSICAEDVVEYRAVDYNGFGFLNDIQNGISAKNYKLKP